MQKRIYIAGCGGMLGEGFYKQFKDDFILKCTDKDVNSPWLSFLDFRNLENYKSDLEQFNPDYLFHIGAYTDLEYCEQHEAESFLTNSTSVEYAVQLANQLSIPLVYISTAGIFNGEKESYDDWAEPDPISVYGRSKYMAECFVVKNAKKYLVCRAGWMMGAGPTKDKKFIQKIMAQIKAGNRELFIVNDKDGSPTYTHDFARNVRLLLDKECWGVYNMVCEGKASRLEVANEILHILNLEYEFKIIPVTSDYFTKEYFAVRPASEHLINRKLNMQKLNIMRDWKVALREYLKEYYNGYLD
jgi:dTDP-4-dehydrorhamnose reductase